MLTVETSITQPSDFLFVTDVIKQKWMFFIIINLVFCLVLLIYCLEVWRQGQ